LILACLQESRSDPRGIEWIVDATGCDVESLRDAATLARLFAAVVEAGQLTPVGPAVWHRFPHTGGLTGLQVLTESHLACHTFPEHGSLCLNVFCCQPRPEWHPDRIVGAIVGAQHVLVRRIERQYGTQPIAVASVTAAASS
jgi:S-adenosylmethionine decarboxylase